MIFKGVFPIIIQSFAILFIFFSTSAQKNQAYWYRAVAAIENENLNEAFLWLDSAIAQNPKNAMYLLKKGEVFNQQSNYNEAIIQFHAADQLKPGIASFGLAKAYAGMENNEMALAELKRHLESNAKESESKIILDPFFDKLSKTNEWSDLWKTDWYSSNERFQAEVQYLFSKQRWDEALEILNKRLEKGRGSHWLFALRGETFYSLGSYKSADADYSEAIKRLKRNPMYFERRAVIRNKLKQHKNALKDIEMALELNSGDPKCLIAKAEALNGLGKTYDAAGFMKIYLSHYPNDLVALQLLAQYAYESSAFLEALFALSKLINSGKADASCYELRGLIYIKSNSWELAQADFLNAVSMDPQRAKVYSLLGEVQMKMGNASDGCTSIKKSMDLGYFPAQELFYKHCKK
jgi:tetratricopeptide (TPR) repeat protein